MMEESKHGLAGEHPLTDSGQMVLFALFLATWIADSFLLRYTVFLALRVPASIRYPLGAATSIAANLLALRAHKSVFGQHGREPGVISTGAFAFVRHPMYLGSWLFCVGLVLMTISVTAAVVCLGMLLFYYLVARHEEQLLVAKFGPKYRSYQARVGMFFPRLGSVCSLARTAQGVQVREAQRYQADPEEAGMTSTSGKTSRNSPNPVRRKRR
jgi:protein-S-isoprenylcysteine O-methyltransferase Ste14